jgi:hypothetical protein
MEGCPAQSCLLKDGDLDGVLFSCDPTSCLLGDSPRQQQNGAAPRLHNATHGHCEHPLLKLRRRLIRDAVAKSEGSASNVFVGRTETYREGRVPKATAAFESLMLCRQAISTSIRRSVTAPLSPSVGQVLPETQVSVAAAAAATMDCDTSVYSEDADRYTVHTRAPRPITGLKPSQTTARAALSTCMPSDTVSPAVRRALGLRVFGDEEDAASRARQLPRSTSLGPGPLQKEGPIGVVFRHRPELDPFPPRLRKQLEALGARILNEFDLPMLQQLPKATCIATPPPVPLSATAPQPSVSAVSDLARGGGSSSRTRSTVPPARLVVRPTSCAAMVGPEVDSAVDDCPSYVPFALPAMFVSMKTESKKQQPHRTPMSAPLLSGLSVSAAASSRASGPSVAASSSLLADRDDGNTRALSSAAARVARPPAWLLEEGVDLFAFDELKLHPFLLSYEMTLQTAPMREVRPSMREALSSEVTPFNSIAPADINAVCARSDRAHSALPLPHGEMWWEEFDQDTKACGTTEPLSSPVTAHASSLHRFGRSIASALPRPPSDNAATKTMEKAPLVPPLRSQSASCWRYNVRRRLPGRVHACQDEGSASSASHSTPPAPSVTPAAFVPRCGDQARILQDLWLDPLVVQPKADPGEVAAPDASAACPAGAVPSALPAAIAQTAGSPLASTPCLGPRGAGRVSLEKDAMARGDRALESGGMLKACEQAPGLDSGGACKQTPGLDSGGACKQTPGLDSGRAPCASLLPSQGGISRAKLLLIHRDSMHQKTGRHHSIPTLSNELRRRLVASGKVPVKPPLPRGVFSSAPGASAWKRFVEGGAAEGASGEPDPFSPEAALEHVRSLFM